MSRDAEMDWILAKLNRPEPAAFVLAGAPGVGKTRLAAEAAKSAAGLGFTTAQAVASRAAAAIPFGPFAPFLPEAGYSPGDLLGLLRTASDAILDRAGPDRRLLLVVDDAQFLDEGSAALVHQLVQKGACSVLASLRTPGPAPEPVSALWKDGLAERIDLTTWGEPETEAVLSAVLGGPVALGSVRRLWEVSQGNALYLRELLIGAVDSGALTEKGGIWSLSRPLTAPGRLVELVASRLSGLAPGTVAVIEMLAAGEPLGVPVLEKITNVAGLEDAEAQGFVQVHQDGRRTVARLAHPVYGEALRQSLPRSRLRRISATLASAIEATGARRREDLLRLGRWQLDSGGPGEPVLLSRAARRASDMFDMDLSARLAQAALDLGGGVDAGLVLGEARFRSGQHAEAEAVLAAMVPRCRTDAERAQIASARAYNLHNLLGDDSAAIAVLDEALAVITDPAPRLQLLGRLATIKVFEPDLEGALAAAKPLLDTDDDVMVSRGAYVSSIALAMLGCGEGAVAVAYRGLESHRRASTLPQLPEAQLIGAVFGHAAGGHLDRAAADAKTGYQACLAAGDKEGMATHLLLAGLVRIDQGQLTRASKVFLDAASVNREIHDPAALRWCLAGLAMAEAMSGHTDRATAAATERDELPVGSMLIYEPDLIERGRAWLNVATGELPGACYRSDGYARPASALTRRAGELAALCGDVSTPGLSFGTQTERLTRREREVAGMAAAGASSREIAAKLVLSVRTVDNHLQNAYSKLGVTSREELARVLRS